MRRPLLSAGILAVMAGAACAHLPAIGVASPLRVMTYNIHSGQGNLAATADAIRALSPDLVALQEVDVHWSERSSFADQAAALGDLLKMQVVFAPIYQLAPINPGDARREFGVALLSKLPVVGFTNHSITRLSTQEKNPEPSAMPGLLEATIDVHGTIVRVFNTHLDFRADPAVRAQQVAEMLGYIGRSALPTILFGDLNATPDAAELQPLLARLDDTWPSSSGPGFTYPADDPRKRIDYVLVSRHFRVRSAAVPAALASDHRPFAVELTIAP
jgi:endonuclease/exonuclease/phosphatase family metal-dependent hydrolase